MMPHHQLKAFQDRLFGLKTCYALSRGDLELAPICPHCGFRPADLPADSELRVLTAGAVLANLDEQLDELVREWTQTLLTNLDDPTVAENIARITDVDGKQAIADFLASRELPDPVPPSFVKALQEALTGLEKVAVTGDGLRGALTQGGVPCTVEELKQRFDRYVAGLTKGKDVKKVRVVVE